VVPLEPCHPRERVLHKVVECHPLPAGWMGRQGGHQREEGEEGGEGRGKGEIER